MSNKENDLEVKNRLLREQIGELRTRERLNSRLNSEIIKQKDSDYNELKTRYDEVFVEYLQLFPSRLELQKIKAHQILKRLIKLLI